MNAKEIVLGELKALGKQDVDGVCQAFAADCYLLDVGLGSSVRGRDELRASLEDLYSAIPDLASKAHRIIAEGKHVAMEYELWGHHKGEMFGVAATDKIVTWRGFAMFEVDVESGVIDSEHYYYDSAAIRSQMSS